MDNEQKPVIYSLGFCIMRPAFNDMFDSEYDHYNDVILCPMASKFTGVSIACSTICSDADQRKHQSSTSLAFGRRIRRGPVKSAQSNAANVSILMTSSWIPR